MTQEVAARPLAASDSTLCCCATVCVACWVGTAPTVLWHLTGGHVLHSGFKVD